MNTYRNDIDNASKFIQDQLLYYRGNYFSTILYIVHPYKYHYHCKSITTQYMHPQPDVELIIRLIHNAMLFAPRNLHLGPLLPNTALRKHPVLQNCHIRCLIKWCYFLLHQICTQCGIWKNWPLTNVHKLDAFRVIHAQIKLAMVLTCPKYTAR